MSGYPDDWDSLRRRVYKRDNYRCCNCHARGGHHGSVELHAHHIVQIASDETHRMSNQITACEPCHQAIHNRGMMAPTADVEHTPSVDILEGVTEAKRSWRKVKRIMGLFS